MRIIGLGLAAVLAMAALGASARAGDSLSPYTLGGVAGSGGLGLSLSRERAFWSNQVSLRAQVEAYDYSDHFTYDSIRYNGSLKLGDLGAYVDYRPFFSSGFIVSAGLQISNRRVALSATPASNVKIGGSSFTPAQVGTLAGHVNLSKATPYLGLGWRQPIVEHVIFSADLGAAIGDKPKASLAASAGLVTQANLTSEQATLAHDARALSVYPIVSMGLGYRF